MKTVVLFSIKGGTGRTSVACNLGAELTQQGRRCTVVDADPQNALGLHLGMGVGERFGVGRHDLTSHDIARHQRGLTKVSYLPFGQSSFEELLEFERLSVESYAWLDERLHRLLPPGTEIALIDLPAGVRGWTYHVVSSADLVLVVLQADAASYATIPATEEMLTRCGARQVAYLVNGMDARMPLSVDVRAAMSGVVSKNLLPFTIPADEAMREAFAQQKTVQEHAPDSQAAFAFGELADWIQAVLRGE
jgi:cellulose synthase operon protein YhjQ